ncbi:MAG: sterol desaturase family protein [Chitinophagaceae bacterium]
MFIIHDTYFYWTHRLMHHKKLFRLFHLVHHHSTNPSPWAAYSFHPLEAVVEAGIFAVFLFIIPVHPLHFYIFFFFMIVYNVYGHLGYELYPKGFSRHWLGKWVNTSVSHNQHHQYFKGNYGLYFTFWDRLMGTIRNDYEKQFEAVKSKKR